MAFPKGLLYMAFPWGLLNMAFPKGLLNIFRGVLMAFQNGSDVVLLMFDVGLLLLDAIWWSMMLCSWKLEIWPADYVRWVPFSLDITLGQLKSSFKQSLLPKNQTLESSNAFSQFSELLPRVKPTSIAWLPSWWPFRKTPVDALREIHPCAVDFGQIPSDSDLVFLWENAAGRHFFEDSTGAGHFQLKYSVSLYFWCFPHFLKFIYDFFLNCFIRTGIIIL